MRHSSTACDAKSQTIAIHHATLWSLVEAVPVSYMLPSSLAWEPKEWTQRRFKYTLRMAQREIKDGNPILVPCSLRQRLTFFAGSEAFFTLLFVCWCDMQRMTWVSYASVS